MGLEKRILSMCAPDNVVQHPLFMGGYSVAQQQAATLAAEADELMREMEGAIDQMVGMYALKHCDEAMKSDECNASCEVLERYRNWKEQNQ